MALHNVDVKGKFGSSGSSNRTDDHECSDPGNLMTRRPSDIVVSVTNSGQGIPSMELPHLFERFYRVEKSRDAALGGAGIGLAIVKRLVELGGGQVGAESATGRTRFWFSLPA